MKRRKLINDRAKLEHSVSQKNAFVRGALFADTHRWVPVSEQLPPNGKWVILAIRIHAGRWYSWEGCWDDGSKCWMEKTDISVAAKMHIPDDWKVTHWLDIPNLPEEEGGWE